jgi:hypothetical protein
VPVNNVADLVAADLAGRHRRSEWVKNVNQVTTAGVWYDLTGSAGNPRAKQWFDATPLVAQQIRQSADGGIYHGANVAGDGYAKYLREVRLGCASATPLPLTLTVCDYLLYYPSVEDGTTDPQVMDNTLALPRWADGNGVQMVAVTISARTGGQTFTVSYTNQDGVAGRTSQLVTQNAVASPGTVTTSATAVAGGAAPVIGLQYGDSGVRSVESVTMDGADTGFFAIVLVRPLATLMVRETTAVYEKDLLLFGGELPRVYDDAYLSGLVLPNGSLSGLAVRGSLKSIWL